MKVTSGAVRRRARQRTGRGGRTRPATLASAGEATLMGAMNAVASPIRDRTFGRDDRSTLPRSEPASLGHDEAGGAVN